MPAVEVSDLVVRHGDVIAVDGISLSAGAGEVVAVLGPNGAGKTTTVETLEGYRRPAAGSVRVLGLDPIADARTLLPRIGVMLQRGGVYPGMHAAAVARLFASYYDDADDPDECLRRAGIEGRVARTPWRALSGGEQQRVSLALALIGRPEVVFLDEPSAGIDPSGRLVIRDVIGALRDSGACVVVTTHDLDECERIADRVVIIDRGRVVAEGAPAELRRGHGEEIRFAAAPGIDVVALGRDLGAAVREARPGEYVAETAPTPAAVAALTAWLAREGLSLGDLRAGRQSLEDVFLRLTSEEDMQR